MSSGCLAFRPREQMERHTRVELVSPGWRPGAQPIDQRRMEPLASTDLALPIYKTGRSADELQRHIQPRRGVEGMELSTGLEPVTSPVPKEGSPH